MKICILNDSVFDLYDNYNVKFSNVLIQSSAMVELMYGESNDLFNFMVLNSKVLIRRTFKEFHVPCR